MGDYSGYKSQIGFGFETTSGVKALTIKPFRLDVKLPIGIKIERNMIERTLLRGSQSKAKSLLGLIKVGGGLSSELYTKQVGYWLRLLMGGIPVTTGPVGTLYTHVFSLLPVVPTVTIEASKGGMPWTYWGLGMSSAEIKVPSVEGVAEISANLIGRNGEPRSISGVLSPTVLSGMIDYPYMNWNMRFKIAGVVIGVRSVSFTVDRQLSDNTAEIKDGCQEALPRHSTTEQRKISGSFNVKFANATHYNRFINGTPAAIEISGTNTENGVTERIKFEFPEVVFEGTDPEVGDMGEMWIDVPFSAFSTLGTENEFKVTLVSTMANYN